MAYVLGFISADGAIIDARKSSRTCYISIKINDLDLLQDIKKCFNSEHTIRFNPERYTKINDKLYLCKKSYTLRFGSKEMFQDLINIGITPRKSLRLKIPIIETKYINFFIRGYFDGDGCINISKKTTSRQPIVQVIFTSGCSSFLKDLSNKLGIMLNINIHNVLNSKSNTYQIRYKKKDTIKILKYMYKNLKSAPYLKRKYTKAIPYLGV